MKVKYLKYVPLQAMIELELNMNEVVFCSILMAFSRDDKDFRAGAENISESMGISGSTIKRIVTSLQKKKLINVASGFKQRNANTYYPTSKLKALYSQNGLIDKTKMVPHTTTKVVYSNEKKEGTFSVPPSLRKKWEEYNHLYGKTYADNAIKRLINLNI